MISKAKVTPVYAGVLLNKNPNSLRCEHCLNPLKPFSLCSLKIHRNTLV